MGIGWRETLAIGVERIDGQHRELLRHFDALLNACEAGLGMEELGNLLDYLDGYVQWHFADEERLQEEHQYPGLEEHRREHEAFIGRIARLRLHIAGEGVALHHLVETNDLLFTWLIGHISGTDRLLGDFLRRVPPPAQ